jgi:hypothetical protein
VLHATITNGIDLAGEGGMVWVKSRTDAGANPTQNNISDTERGTGNKLITNGTYANIVTPYENCSAFNSDGFAYNDGFGDSTNKASWTFRKAEKFFDVVTYTGDGTAGRALNHSLNSVPGCVLIKCTSHAGDWIVWHRGLNTTQPSQDYLVLNSTAAKISGNYIFYNGAGQLSSTQFGGLGPYDETNLSGRTYVAYLFAHDAGGFGDDGEQNIISCGSYTGTGVAGLAVTLGWEPQWILWKNASQNSNWNLYDNMRSMSVSGDQATLYANTAVAELTYAQFPFPTATGFIVNEGGGPVNASGDTHIYIAIRRGPMRAPTSGTEVFAPSTRAGTGAAATTSNLSFPPDMVWSKGRDNGGTNSGDFDRLRGAAQQLSLNQADSETTASTSLTGFDVMTGYAAGADAAQLTINATGYNYANWQFRRAPASLMWFAGQVMELTHVQLVII